MHCQFTDLMDSQKFDHDNFQLNPTFQNIGAVIKEAIDVIDPHARHKKITFSTELKAL